VEAHQCAGGFNASDSTNALQSAFHSGAHAVHVRNMGSPWILTQIVSLAAGNQTVLFAAGVIVQAQRWAPAWANSGLPQPLLRTLNAGGSHNVTLRGATGSAVRMWRTDYANKTLYPVHNEWRHGLWISGSTDITVQDLRFEESGGDGISIDWASERILIQRVVCDKNYRLGLSIINAAHVLVEDSHFSNSAGTGPEGGIDLEPDFAWAMIENITFRNLTIVGNLGPAFSVALAALQPFNASIDHRSFSKPCIRHSSDPPCNVSITLENSVLDGTSASTPSIIHTKDHGAYNILSKQFGVSVGALHRDGPRGTILIANTTIRNLALSGVAIMACSANAASVDLRNVTIVDTALNRTVFWSKLPAPDPTGGLNAQLALQNGADATWGPPGNIHLDGVHVWATAVTTRYDKHAKPWLYAQVDNGQSFVNTDGTVIVHPPQHTSGVEVVTTNLRQTNSEWCDEAALPARALGSVRAHIDVVCGPK
jgi:hypothetical protein